MFNVTTYSVFKKLSPGIGGGEGTLSLMKDGLSEHNLREYLNNVNICDVEDIVVGQDVKNYVDVTEQFSWMIRE